MTDTPENIGKTTDGGSLLTPCSLFCTTTKVIDGKMESVNTPDLFVWACVDTKTGEVEMTGIRTHYDELEDYLVGGWEWRLFLLVEANSPPNTNQTKMTDTPETDKEHQTMPMGGFTLDFARKLEGERDMWKAKFIQQNKDLGCEMMDPNGTIWDYAKKLQKDLDADKARLDWLCPLGWTLDAYRADIDAAIRENHPTNQNE
jgi:hypothetical protein